MEVARRIAEVAGVDADMESQVRLHRAQGHEGNASEAAAVVLLGRNPDVEAAGCSASEAGELVREVDVVGVQREGDLWAVLGVPDYAFHVYQIRAMLHTMAD